MRLLKIALGLSSFLISHAAFGADYPTGGIVFNQIENSSLAYTCSLMQDGTLQCEFDQSRVHKKLKTEGVAKRLQDAEKEFEKVQSTPSDDAQCKDIPVFLQMLQGDISIDEGIDRLSKKPDDQQAFATGVMTTREKAKKFPDELDMFKAMGSYCADRTKENYVNLAKQSINRDLKTCEVSANHFSQTFIKVADGTPSGAWVVKSGPDGPCGLIQLSRFEIDQTSVGGSSYSFWNYIAKKTITNPKGTILPTLTCAAGVDQNEYPYTWREKSDSRLGCEYVEFSAF